MKVHKLTSKKSKIIALLTVIVLVILTGGFMYASGNNTADSEIKPNTTDTAPTSEQPQTESQSQQNTEQPSASTSATTPSSPVQPTPQWPVQLTANQASSLTVVVNKKHQLPSSYAPALGPSGKLRAEAETAFNTMLAAAKANGAPNMIYLSGFRSYTKQQQLYNNYVAQDGQAAADTYSARPGHSEHQTGLAVDIGEGGSCDLETCFENTASAKWVAANAYQYGFIVRYPKGKDAITGYQYEPWHLRYLGVSEATAVYNSSKTLEEYYGVPGGGY